MRSLTARWESWRGIGFAGALALLGCGGEARVTRVDAGRARDATAQIDLGPPVPPEPCVGAASCDACARDARCGWCASTGRCMVAGDAGPAEGTCGGASAERVFDPFNDFSAARNPTPDGVWRFGYAATPDGPFTHFTHHDRTQSVLDRWRRPDVVEPSVVHNPTGADVTYGEIVFPGAGALHLHPGPSGELAVARWTAPGAAEYRVRATFRSLRSAPPATTDVHVRVAGREVFAEALAAEVAGEGDAGMRLTYESTHALAAGDTIDFAVGYGTNRTFTSDSTGLAVAIEPATPVASSWRAGADACPATADAGADAASLEDAVAPTDVGAMDARVDVAVDAGPACGANGASCSRHGNCCSHYCDFATHRCLCHPTDWPFAPPPADMPIRNDEYACRQDSDCCSGACSGGACVRRGDCHPGCRATPGSCGTFGCRGTCGRCEGRGTCQPDGTCCENACDPSWACGPDRCGTLGVCGGCPTNYTCQDHRCVYEPPCVESCSGHQCNRACSGQSCGTCTGAARCTNLNGHWLCVTSCRADGFACASGSECCAGTCTNGLCGGGCRPETAPCSAGPECCSGRCVGGTCAAGSTCRPDGVACAQPSECCSSACTAGRCGATSCGPEGTACTGGAQCCSGACTLGRCAAGSSCLVDGAACSSGAACCAGTCSGGRCGGGSGGCTSYNSCLRVVARSGNRCGSATSLEVTFTNECAGAASVRVCLQDATGACRFTDFAIDRGATLPYFTCQSTGRYCFQGTDRASPSSCREISGC